MSATLTCEQCLAGRLNRCAGPGKCARWKTDEPKRRKSATPTPQAEGAERRHTHGGGRPWGSMRGVPPETQHAIAVDIVTAEPCSTCGGARYSKRALAEKHGVTYEQVRSVERQLKALAS